MAFEQGYDADIFTELWRDNSARDKTYGVVSNLNGNTELIKDAQATGAPLNEILVVVGDTLVTGRAPGKLPISELKLLVEALPLPAAP